MKYSDQKANKNETKENKIPQVKGVFILAQGSGVPSILIETSEWQELEGAGHLVTCIPSQEAESNECRLLSSLSALHSL